MIVGALILKEALNVTDDEIVEAMAFDIRYQGIFVRLNSTEEWNLTLRVSERWKIEKMKKAVDKCWDG